MKNIILTILCSVISFSFAQRDIKMSESMQKKNTELKKMAVKAVDYLDNQLKLSSKQKTVLSNEYSRYANALIRAQVKNMDRQNNTSKKESSYGDTKKTLAPLVMRLSEKRDAAIIKVLKAKQVKTYNKHKTLINPLTLEVRSPKAKTKK
tara:strand:+ start:692 stop:1141 length:450 start_codon:yes stop_codon:yes gene_type:complete